MLIYESTWKKIRNSFSTKDKAEINRAVSGESICPRGLFIDEDSNGLPEELRVRFFSAVREQMRKDKMKV